MKKIFAIILFSVLTVAMLAGCTNDPNTADPNGSVDTPSNFDSSKDISVISREDGSGTRGAFIELFEIEQKNDDGTKKDLTTKAAVIAKQTNIMMTNVAGDKYAIGYISLGSLNDSVKAIQIEGVTATTENVKNGAYPVKRPFNIATKGEASGLAKDFIDFILSADGQAVVSDSYIAIVEDAAAYVGNQPSGKLVVAGSSSVSPVMEKLIEAYKAINPNAQIELQTNDSSAGMKAAISGTCDIGMASRDLKDSELEELISTQIAWDGLAVIVNQENSLTNLTKEQVKAIFTGETYTWDEVI